ncbi:MAG: SDR family NAD(P)-dependent oxidoreductase [Bacteroidota bacterium]|nr:SDR family NAD(P)-dependent oxidoreductase [Bacteroidota bacterium]
MKLNFIKKLVQLDGSPKIIAKGFATGSFIGMMPIPGFQMLVAIFVSTFTKISRKAAIIGVFNTNMATGIFVFAFNYWLGRNILGVNPDFVFPEKITLHFAQIIFTAGRDVFLSMIVGGFITGIFSAIISYFIIKKIITKKTIKKIYMKQKYSVITGASKGLGRELSIETAKKNKNLILIALPFENINEFANELKEQYGVKVVTFEANLTDENQLQEISKMIVENYDVDTLINNAGIGGTKKFSEASKSYIDNILMLNIRALVLLTYNLLPTLKKQDKAFIMNIASVAAFSPMPFKTVYPASKAFVSSFTRGLSTELRNTNISVSVVYPGGMPTNPEIADRIKNHSRFVRSTILSPEKTAQISISKMLSKKSFIIPGFMNKMSWLFMNILPVDLILYIFSKTVVKELKSEKQTISGVA